MSPTACTLHPADIRAMCMVAGRKAETAATAATMARAGIMVADMVARMVEQLEVSAAWVEV